MHESDTAVMSDEDYFSFGNVGEVLPEESTPLALSVSLPALQKGLLKFFPLYDRTMFVNNMMSISHNRVVVNVFPIFLKMVNKEITIQNRIHALTVLGHEFLTEEIHQMAIHRFGIASKRNKMINMWTIVKCSWKAKSAVEEMGRFIERCCSNENQKSDPKMSKSLDEMYEDLSEKISEDLPYMHSVHALVSSMSSVYQIILFSAMGEGRKNITSEYLEDITMIMSSCKNAESAEIPIQLEEMASTLLNWNKIKTQEFVAIESDKGIEWLADNCTMVHKLFESFIRKHAHRGFREVT